MTKRTRCSSVMSLQRIARHRNQIGEPSRPESSRCDRRRRSGRRRCAWPSGSPRIGGTPASTSSANSLRVARRASTRRSRCRTPSSRRPCRRAPRHRLHARADLRRLRLHASDADGPESSPSSATVFPASSVGTRYVPCCLNSAMRLVVEIRAVLDRIDAGADRRFDARACRARAPRPSCRAGAPSRRSHFISASRELLRRARVADRQHAARRRELDQVGAVLVLIPHRLRRFLRAVDDAVHPGGRGRRARAAARPDRRGRP